MVQNCSVWFVLFHNGEGVGVIFLEFTIYDLRYTIYDIRYTMYDLRLLD